MEFFKTIIKAALFILFIQPSSQKEQKDGILQDYALSHLTL